LRELWIKIDDSLPQQEKNDFVTATSRYVFGYISDVEDVELFRKAGASNIVSIRNGDLQLVHSLEDLELAKREGKRAFSVVDVQSKTDEEKVIDLAKASSDYVSIKCLDWKVIPIENLIAALRGKSKLLAWISGLEEVKLVSEALEIGVDGVIVEQVSIDETEQLYEQLSEVKTRKEERETAQRIALEDAQIISTKQIGSGARVCVDTCDMMKEGEGMLVGCQSSGLFLVQAEVMETPFVAPRPFRVNAGPVAQYVLTPSGTTRYLSELRAGEEVLIVDREGRSRTVNVCRVKIEWRPMMLVEAEAQGKRVKAILQNAETIRLVTKDGHKSVVDLKPGDTLLVRLEEGGRHFGTLVKEETVIEK